MPRLIVMRLPNDHTAGARDAVEHRITVRRLAQWRVHLEVRVVRDGALERLRAVAVEPCAGEAEIGPRPFLQAEQAGVVRERLLRVFGDDGEVVHSDDHAVS